MGLLQGLGNFSNRVSGLLFPGMEATGTDPRIAQAAKAQAMMQMGAGLLGGQNFGQAYGLGQQAGYEPIEQARRQELVTAAAQDRQAMADERNRRRQQEEAAIAQQQKAREVAAPFLQSGDYEGARRALLTAGLWDESKAMPNVRDDGAKIGAYNPGDYTPESFSDFIKGGMSDPSKLRRQYAPPAPPSQTVIQLPTGQAAFNPRTGTVTQLSTREDQRTAAAADEAAKAAAIANVERQGVVEKRLAQATDADAVLEVATPLILQSTGSGAGAAADKVAGFFGVSLDGAQAAAALQALQATLIQKMPRLEGPQSDKDRELYIQAAGQIGDPTVPRETKQSAIRTIRQINAQYQSANQKRTSAPVRIMGQADYDRLPSGAEYIAPDGTTRTKK